MLEFRRLMAWVPLLVVAIAVSIMVAAASHACVRGL